MWQTDGRTDRRTDWTIHRAAWSQLKTCSERQIVQQRCVCYRTIYPNIRCHAVQDCNKKTHVTWLLWHWSSRCQSALQSMRPLGRVGSKFNWQSKDQCQGTHSKWVFVCISHLKSKYCHLILSKLSRKSAICPRRSPWLLVSVRSLRSARLDIAWLVKSVTYFDLIGWIDGRGRQFQRSKYKFSSHPKTLELIFTQIDVDLSSFKTRGIYQ